MHRNASRNHVSGARNQTNMLTVAYVFQLVRAACVCCYFCVRRLRRQQLTAYDACRNNVAPELLPYGTTLCLRPLVSGSPCIV